MEEKLPCNRVDLSLEKMNSILMREDNYPISNRLRTRSGTESGRAGPNEVYEDELLADK